MNTSAKSSRPKSTAVVPIGSIDKANTMAVVPTQLAGVTQCFETEKRIRLCKTQYKTSFKFGNNASVNPNV